LVVLTLVAKTAMDRLSIPPWGNPLGGGQSLEVAGDGSVGQEFTAPLPGLYRIEIALIRAADDDVHRVTIHLKDDLGSARDLSTVALDTQEVQEDIPYGFEFEPIRDSAGQTYYLYVESAGSMPGSAIAVGYSPDSVLEGACAYLNGVPLTGNLQFQTFYSLRTRDRIGLLLARMADGRPFVLGNKGLYLGLAMAYAVVFGVFLWLVVRAVLETPEERT
jgi:hypothetical protein